MCTASSAATHTILWHTTCNVFRWKYLIHTQRETVAFKKTFAFLSYWIIIQTNSVIFCSESSQFICCVCVCVFLSQQTHISIRMQNKNKVSFQIPNDMNESLRKSIRNSHLIIYLLNSSTRYRNAILSTKSEFIFVFVCWPKQQNNNWIISSFFFFSPVLSRSGREHRAIDSKGIHSYDVRFVRRMQVKISKYIFKCWDRLIFLISSGWFTISLRFLFFFFFNLNAWRRFIVRYLVA